MFYKGNIGTGTSKRNHGLFSSVCILIIILVKCVCLLSLYREVGQSVCGTDFPIILIFSKAVHVHFSVELIFDFFVQDIPWRGLCVLHV